MKMALLALALLAPSFARADCIEPVDPHSWTYLFHGGGTVDNSFSTAASFGQCWDVYRTYAYCEAKCCVDQSGKRVSNQDCQEKQCPSAYDGYNNCREASR